MTGVPSNASDTASFVPCLRVGLVTPLERACSLCCPQPMRTGSGCGVLAQVKRRADADRCGRRLTTRHAGANSQDASESGEKGGENMTQFNAAIYEELRDKFAVAQEAPTILSKRGGSEIFTYMPPSFREKEESQRLLPHPDLTPIQVISTVLQAMKANRKFGCSIYLRFMSDKHQYSRLSAQDLELQLEMGGQTQVLLGNFREFSFPIPTIEMNADCENPVAVQEVRLLVPGPLHAHPSTHPITHPLTYSLTHICL